MTKAESAPIILWFRKDLRLDDNLALAAATGKGVPLIPVYIREPEEAGTGPLGGAQSWWLHQSLISLSQSLSRLGSRLILRSGNARDVVAQIAAETGATEVLWNRRYEPPGIAVDAALKQSLADIGVSATSFAGQLLHEPSRIRTGSGMPYRVYTPFWRTIEGAGEPPEPIGAPASMASPGMWPASEGLDDWKLAPSKPDWAIEFAEIWTPGEAGAHAKLDAFIAHGIAGYKAERDYPALPHTSNLSPHLAMGEISPARVWHATRGISKRGAAEDVIHFRKELVWREFSYHLLFHFPELAEKNWNERFDAFPWRNDPERLEEWKRGRTGYPIVDAGMRQLWRHGTMHNRVRMIVASFLIKDLMIDWREGERWFRDTLVDADPASNAAGWQWVAGSGADASPFFRIFNPVTQGEKFDPDGAYVRRFVPELRNLDSTYIHRPFEAPQAILERSGVRLGNDYPYPVVDHRMARDRALAAYKALP